MNKYYKFEYIFVLLAFCLIRYFNLNTQLFQIMTEQNTVILELNEFNKVTINLHGATITSWISNNKERLFLSEKAIFDNKKAIRGGIPVVFPNFGPWDNNRPQHGFARTKQWQVKEPVKYQDNFGHVSAHVTLVLCDDEETRKLWDNSFELLLEVVLKINSLTCTLTVENKNDQNEFDFTCLLHTYFKVLNIIDVRIHDLKGCVYNDKVNNVINTETNEVVTINSEVDRAYTATPDTHLLDLGCGDQIIVKKHNLPDTVVWNPWVEKSIKMADFGDDEYKIMFCVEPGYVNSPRKLKSKEKFSASQELIVVIKEKL